MAAEQPVETTTAKLWLDDRDIAHIDFKPQATETIETAEENYRVLLEVMGGEKRLLLVDVSVLASATREARDFRAKGPPSGHSKAAAAIGSSVVGRTLINFFIKVSQPESNFRMFESEEAALAWLETQRD